MTKLSILSTACIVAVQCCLACASDADSPPMAGGGGNAGVSDGSSGGSTGVTGAATGDSGALPTMAADLTDAEMLKVLDSASKGEIERGRVAAVKAQNPAVRAFASKLVKEYTIIGYSAAVTAYDMGLTPPTNEVATMVTSMGDAVTQGMNTTPSGAEFDRKYMDIQIAADKGMLAVVDPMLTNADGTPVRALLADTLQANQRHLDEASLIRFALK